MSAEHSQVRHTEVHHDNSPATTPEVTAVGNTAGITTGHISHKIVPPIRAARVNKTIAIIAIPTTLKILSIYVDFS